MAARAGQVEVVRCLLRNGAIVDARARVRWLLPKVACQERAVVFASPRCHSSFTVSSSGGPDSPPHCVPSGKNRDCAAAAATHGPSRCCHHQRLHPPPHLGQGGAGGDRLCPARGWSVTLAGHQGGSRKHALSFFIRALLQHPSHRSIQGALIVLLNEDKGWLFMTNSPECTKHDSLLYTFHHVLVLIKNWLK